MLPAAFNASAMLEEVQGAEEWIEGFFQDWDERIRKLHGPGWRGDGQSDGEDGTSYDPENFGQEWYQIVGSQFILGNPRARFTTDRTGPERTMVKAHQLAVNRWVRETEFRALNKKLVADFGLHRAICLTLPNQTGDGNADLDDPLKWPTAKRISPKRYVYDVKAIEKEEELWRGHRSIHMKDELLARAEEHPEERWDIEAIEALTEDAEVDELRGKGRGREGSANRREVVLYNIWVRDYDPNAKDVERYGEEAWGRQLRVGAWLTLGVVDDAKGGWVRHPRPYWGHRRGPYVLCDGMIIPDEPVGLAPIPAVEEQVKELNKHARALSRAMANYKKGILVDASDPDFEQKIKGFEDHWVVGLDGLDEIDKKVKEITLAGAEEQGIAHVSLCRDRVMRNGGVTDLQRGQTEAGVTATADQLAQNASATKVGAVAVDFIEFDRQILENISIYIGYADGGMKLGPEARRVLMDESGKPVEAPVYWGGISDQNEADWFAALGLEIEPFSMGQTSEGLEQAQALQFINLLAVLLPMMAQYPFVLWEDFLETIGERFNQDNLGDYFDPDVLAQYQALMLQGMQAKSQGRTMQKPKARLSRDMSVLLGGRQRVPKTGNLVGALMAGQAKGGL